MYLILFYIKKGDLLLQSFKQIAGQWTFQRVLTTCSYSLDAEKKFS